MNRLRKYVLIGWLCLATSMVMLVGNASRLFGRSVNARATRSVARWWARGVLRITGATCRVEGRSHVNGTGPYVVMCSHRSHMDTPVLIEHLPFAFGFIVKRELMRIPVFSGAMKAIGCVAVSRRRSREDHAVMDGVARAVAEGKNIVIFPEGSRAPSDEFLPFKKGGIVLAIKSQMPILPVAASGTNRVILTRQMEVHPGPVLLRIGEPIPTKGLTLSDRDVLLEQVRRVITELYQPAYTGECQEIDPCEPVEHY